MPRSRIAWLLLLAAAGMTPLAAGLPIEAASAAEAENRARSETLEDLANKLEARFVSPKVGAEYAAMLRAAAKSGKYDSIASDTTFAEQVTADLQAIAFDGHLKLVPEQSASGQGGPGKLPDTIESQARLTGDIAYIRFGKFFGEPQDLAAIAKFLNDNADAKTVIFDVRTHIGGGLDEMDVIFPYLFADETVLVGMDTRTGIESPVGDGPTVRPVASPAGVVRREHFVVPAAGAPLARAKVYVLASGRTGSAGEHFVLSLKRTGRATVIGETTYGAGNFGTAEQIAGGFQIFIPVGRTFDPGTDRGWDYVGIAPNIAVPAAQALVEALHRSGVPRSEAELLDSKYGTAADRVSSKRKAPASVAGI